MKTINSSLVKAIRIIGGWKTYLGSMVAKLAWMPNNSYLFFTRRITHNMRKKNKFIIKMSRA